MGAPVAARPRLFVRGVIRMVVGQLTCLLCYTLVITFLSLARWNPPQIVQAALALSAVGLTLRQAIAVDRLCFRALRSDGHLCTECGHPLLEGVETGICSECGVRYTLDSARASWRRVMPRGWYARLGIRIGLGR